MVHKISSYNILDRAGNKKILLFEPQLSPLKFIIIWVKNFRNVFRDVFLFHGFQIITMLKIFKIKFI